MATRADIPEGRDWIYEQYVTLGKKVCQIAKEFNCDRHVISDRLTRHNISRKANYSIPEDKDWIFTQVPPKELSNNNNHIYDRNPDNYKWLCIRCHMIKDGKGFR